MSDYLRALRLPYTSQGTNNQLIVDFPDGSKKQYPYPMETYQRDESARLAVEDANAAIDALNERLGRPVTDIELHRGRVEHSLSKDQQEEVDAFRVRFKKPESQLDRDISKLEAEKEEARIARLPRAERLLEEQLRLRENKLAEAEAKLTQEQRNLKYASTVKRLQARQQALKWDESGGYMSRLIANALTVLDTPGSDMGQFNDMVRKVENIDNANVMAKHAAVNERRAALESEIASLPKIQSPMLPDDQEPRLPEGWTREDFESYRQDQMRQHAERAESP